MSNKRFEPSKVLSLEGKCYGTKVQAKRTPACSISEKTLTDLPPLPPMLPAFNAPADGDSTQLYTSDQMRAYGRECYEQGILNKSNPAAPELLDACQNAREMIATDRQAFVDRHRLQDNRTEDPIAHGLVAAGDGAWLDYSDAEALRDYDQSLALINAAITKATGETP